MGGHTGAKVAAVGSIPLVPESLHQPVPQARDERPVNTWARRAWREGVARQGRHDQVEPVAETVDQRKQLDKRAGPAVSQYQRDSAVGGAVLDEGDAHAVHVGDPVIETVEPPLLPAP